MRYLFGQHWVMPIIFLVDRSLNHKLRRAMDAAIVHASVQICDVNPEQPTDFFYKKKKNHWSLFFTNEINELFGIDIADLNTNSGNGCVLRSLWWLVSDWKLWKVTTITQWISWWKEIFCIIKAFRIRWAWLLQVDVW